jgi:hypothetical protein
MRAASTTAVLLVLSAAVAAQDVAARAPAELDAYDVVWTTPSADEGGSMPVGDGLVGANVWVEPDGVLRLLVGRLDAWSETQRLLKLGRVDVTFDPPLLPAGATFEQRLRLRHGRIEIRGGGDDAALSLVVFVDPDTETVHVAGASAVPRRVRATPVTWRTARRELRGNELKTSWVLRDAPADVPAWESPDVVLPKFGVGVGARVGLGWAHRNAWSCVPLHVERQRLGDAAALVPDVLADRTSGAVVFGPRLRSDGAAVASSEPWTRVDLRIATHVAQTPTLDAWREELTAKAARTDSAAGYERAAARWNAFWDRSWIFVDAPSAPAVPRNAHPFRIGADSAGGNVFPGAIAAYDFAPTAWSTEAVVARAAVPPDAPRAVARPVFDGRPLDVPETEAPARDAPALSLSAWVRPTGPTGRIFDRLTPGGVDGFLLDVHDGRPRLIVGTKTLHAPDRLPADRFSHVAAVVDGRTGAATLYVDGRPVAGVRPGDPPPPSAATQAYLLARYVAGAQSRAPRPIPFQGGLFTIAADKTPNGARGAFGRTADDRNWGQSVWWQNVRLVYHPLLAQGSVDAMRPLFDFYFDRAPLFRAQSKRLFGAEGVFVFETTSLFGLPGMGDWGWKPTDPPAFQEPYTRNIWQQPLELACLALDAWEHGGDDAFLRDRALPWADDALRFFATRFPRDAAGRLRITPSHAVETYWEDVVNDLPSVAGLHALTRRLLALPADALGAERRARVVALADALPPIPTRTVDGNAVFAAAEAHEPNRRNVEAPEMYGVFPFRVHGLGAADVEIARATYRRMTDPHRTCWHQTGLFAALCGLADEAAADFSTRARNRPEGFRFPGFSGTPYDWAPDMDGAGNLQSVLQLMLLQAEGDAIRLLPAWPAGWNARFKLHAPRRTVVEGEVKDGKLVRIAVDPPARAKDVKAF